MKSLKKFSFPIMAVVLGAGLALSTSSFTTFNAPNVYNTNTTDPDHPNWVPIPSGDTVSCDDESDFDCQGYKATPTSPVTQIQSGVATLNP